MIKYLMNADGRDIFVAFPMVVERIMIAEILAANNINTWTTEAELARNVVPMTAKELAWFTRL